MENYNKQIIEIVLVILLCIFYWVISIPIILHIDVINNSMYYVYGIGFLEVLYYLFLSYFPIAMIGLLLYLIFIDNNVGGM